MQVHVAITFVFFLCPHFIQAIVVYSSGATSERNLPLCNSPREACNVIRKRYWMSDLVLRQCKCPDLSECPDSFSEGRDRRTIPFNARAQLKFCSQVGDLGSCMAQNVAVHIGSGGSITVHCNCGRRHYFQEMRNNSTGQYFRCVPLGNCKRGEFCGHITASGSEMPALTHPSYETYHQCACPSKHICVIMNRETNDASEFLYQGQAFKGFCIKL